MLVAAELHPICWVMSIGLLAIKFEKTIGIRYVCLTSNIKDGELSSSVPLQSGAPMNSDLRTAVIVPMLMATLANGQNLLRITVLSSLRTTNAADWQLKCLSPQHGAGFLYRNSVLTVDSVDLSKT